MEATEMSKTMHLGLLQLFQEIHNYLTMLSSDSYRSASAGLLSQAPSLTCTARPGQMFPCTKLLTTAHATSAASSAASLAHEGAHPRGKGGRWRSGRG